MQEKPASYFEGVLQLRGCSDEVLDWAHDEIIRAGRAKIAKAKEVRGGVDIYLSSQHYMQSLGRQLQSRFGGIVKITGRLYTRNPITSRDVHRMTVLFKQLPFKTGDIVKLHGGEWKVLSVGNQIRMQNTKTGEKIRMPADKLVKHLK